MDGNFPVRFSTDELPEDRRFEIWRETFSRAVLKTDVTALSDEPFHAKLAMCMLPGLGISWGQNSSQRAERTSELLIDGDDDVLLVMLPAGTATWEQVGRQTVVRTGSATLVSGADRGAVSCSSGFSHITLKLPRRELSPLVRDLDRAIMRLIEPDVEALRMLGVYLNGFRSGLVPATPELRHLVGTHIRDLAALALGATSDTSEMLRGRGLRAARLRGIRAHIAANLDRPGLSLDIVAASQGISPRYVQTLLKEAGTTFSDLVISQRLVRAHQMLMDPRLTSRSISAIAFDAGFSDVSYFNRVFRRAYGRTPSDVKEKAKAIQFGRLSLPRLNQPVFDSMAEVSDIPFGRVLDPMERISETLFGLIMALTFICSLGVATSGNIKIQTMLIGALGCNLAWGIVDGGLYLLARINDQGRNILTLRAIQQAPDAETARRVIADAIQPELASVLPPEQLELMRQKLQQLPEPSGRPRLTKRDWIGALGLCSLSFLSTFPVVIPFIFLSDAKFALRVSYAIAIMMLFCCGYVFGHHSGLRPWAAGLSMVAVGSALVGVAVALGG